MRLVVISHTPHHRDGAQIVGWGPTIVELDHLATRFDVVRHVACLYDGPAPKNARPYSARNVELVPVKPSGADGLWGKLDVLRTSPLYAQAILAELADADVVHVRAPANIALIAILLLLARKKPNARWFKYAGNWQPIARESPSYTIQRWLLSRRDHHGLVTVNGVWPGQPPWVRTFFNPSLEDADLERGARVAETKQLGGTLQLLFVGTVARSKGADRAIEIAHAVRARGIDAHIELIGDGEERFAIEQEALQTAPDLASFKGWQDRAGVYDAYARAHLLLLPSRSEGWPKVLSEGMAFGVVPLASSVSSIPQYLARFETGAAFDSKDTTSFVDAIEAYARAPDRWAAHSRNAVVAARNFSFRQYLAAIDELLSELLAGQPGH